MAIYSITNASTFDYTFDETFQDTTSRSRGSRGGATFQRIGNSFAIRHRVAIILKRSARQTHSQNRLGAIQSRWRSLDASEKQSFADEVANYPRVDSLGNPYVMQAINLQQSANTNANTLGEPLIDNMPALQPPPAISLDAAIFQLASNDYFIETDPSVLPATHSLLIYATRPLSPGQLTSQNMFVYMAMVPPSTAPNNVNFFPVYEQTWGADPSDVGKVIFVHLRFISQVSFMEGLSIEGSGIIQNI